MLFNNRKSEFFGSFIVTLLTLSCGLYIMDRRPHTLLLCVVFFGGLLACNTRGCWLAFLTIIFFSLFLLTKKKFIIPFLTLIVAFTLVTITMNYTRKNHISGRAKSIESQISTKKGSWFRPCSDMANDNKGNRRKSNIRYWS